MTVRRGENEILSCPLETNKAPETDLKLRMSVYNHEEKVREDAEVVLIFFLLLFIQGEKNAFIFLTSSR